MVLPLRSSEKNRESADLVATPPVVSDRARNLADSSMVMTITISLSRLPRSWEPTSYSPSRFSVMFTLIEFELM